MKNAVNVTKLTSPKVSDINITATVEDPKIIKIAKLALVLADDGIDDMTKLLSIKACQRVGYITDEEASQLVIYKKELEELAHSGDNEEEDN